MRRVSDNLTKTQMAISSNQRWARNKHRGAVVWLTGLSGSGKSTLATLLEKQLFESGRQTFVLDGDNLRFGLCSDLGFSEKDREENIRRVGEVAALFSQAGQIVICAFISPYQKGRDLARQATPSDFYEIYLKADLEICETRDPKGLYAKAREGRIKDFTGIGAPYEVPHSPDLIIESGKEKAIESLEKLLRFVETKVAI
jgi:adenylyl-sulfate kinase